MSLDGDLLLQPPLTDVEEYVGGSASTENQLLYVVLGTVLGVVVLVTVVCIAMCMWKQQQHQRQISEYYGLELIALWSCVVLGPYININREIASAVTGMVLIIVLQV